MKYWYIYQVNSVWYVWDLRRRHLSSLKIKDAIYHSLSIKELLFHLEKLSGEDWLYRGMVMNTEFSPFDGTMISIGGNNEKSF